MDYEVTKQHHGDKQYFEGDIRHVSNKTDAKRLIDLGLIAEIDESKPRTKASTKQEKEPANKMAKEPENKSE